MPVSSPSYFPPQRSQDRIVGLNAGTTQTGNNVFLAGQEAGLDSTSSGLIVIGHLSGNGAIVNAPNTIIIGVESGQSIVQSRTDGVYLAADAGIVIGYNCLNKTSSVNGSIVIGSNNFGQLSPAGSSVNYQGIQNSIVLGSAIMNGANALASTNPISSSVIIGYGFNANNTFFAGVGNCVIIGQDICNSDYSNGFSGAVVIGGGACSFGVPSSCTVIGTQALSSNTTNGAFSEYIVAIGTNAAPNIGSGNGIYLGHNAGGNYPGDLKGLIIITDSQTVSNYPIDSAFAALMNPQSDGAVNVELGGIGSNSNLQITGLRNALILNNGTVGNANPKRGGYFYVTAGALHWVGSNGTDTQIAPA